MSDARASKRWMPNRMFDPVSNPFAIQNLLEKEQPPFTEARDERPRDGFGIDALMSGPVLNSFEIDQRLRADDEATDDEMTAAGFVADAAHPAEPFMNEAVAASTGFTPETGDGNGDPAGDSLAPDAMGMQDRPADALAATDAGITPSTLGSDDAMAKAVADESVTGKGDTAESEAADADAAHAISTDEVTDPLTSEAVQQMIEAARAEGHAQGLQAGLAQGREVERPVAHQQGYDEGFAAGLAQARTDMQADQQQRDRSEHEAKLAQLQTVIDGLQQLAGDPDALFEPMKQLSVHLAEQLVRGELAQSPQAISRLVDNALRELNTSGDKAVVVHLHPEDLESYRPTVAQFADSLILRPDNLLERGSVRVSLDGSVVEDLLQRRVAGLKRSLAQPAAPGWRAAGGKLSERLADGQRGSTHVEDVTPVNKAERTTEAAAPAQGDA